MRISFAFALLFSLRSSPAGIHRCRRRARERAGEHFGLSRSEDVDSFVAPPFAARISEAATHPYDAGDRRHDRVE
jgi:hypothetical protein